MMFFYKKKKHKKHKNKGSGCIKEKKRFGLTNSEMDNLLLQMICKPKIPIESQFNPPIANSILAIKLISRIFLFSFFEFLF